MQTSDSGASSDDLSREPAFAQGAPPLSASIVSDPVPAAAGTTTVASEPATQPSSGSGLGMGRTGGMNVDAYLRPVQDVLAPLDQVGRRTIAWIGAGLLAIAVLLFPVASVSVLFLNVTFKMWTVSHLDWFLLLLCAAAAAGVAYLRDYKWLWAAGGLALLILLYKAIDIMTTAGLSLSWGWIVLFPAALLILVAAAMRPNPAEVSGDAAAYARSTMQRFSNR